MQTRTHMFQHELGILIAAEIERLKENLAAHTEEIQCIVGRDYIPFGKAQQPELWDYADGVDTMEFLNGLT